MRTPVSSEYIMPEADSSLTDILADGVFPVFIRSWYPERSSAPDTLTGTCTVLPTSAEIPEVSITNEPACAPHGRIHRRRISEMIWCFMLSIL